MEAVVPVEEEVEDHQQRNQEYELMHKAVGSLGEPCKSLLEAYYLQKKPMQEIALSTSVHQCRKCEEPEV